MVPRPALLLAVAAGCYQPPDLSCAIECRFFEDALCPEDLTCVSGPFLTGICVDDPRMACEPFEGPAVAGTPFGAPIPIPTLATGVEEDDPTLTADMVEMYLSGTDDLHVSKRVGDTYAARSLVTELDAAATQFRPRITADGLTLYFARRFDGPPRHDDIFVTTRATRETPWEPPVPLSGDINTPDNSELPAWTSPDGLTLVFEAHGLAPGAQHDLVVAHRPSRDAAFVRTTTLGYVNTADANEAAIQFSDDGTMFVFESNRLGQTDIFEGFRDGATWTIVHHPELASSAALKTDGAPWLSADGRTIIFSSNRSGTDDLFIATRP